MLQIMSLMAFWQIKPIYSGSASLNYTKNNPGYFFSNTPYSWDTAGSQTRMWNQGCFWFCFLSTLLRPDFLEIHLVSLSFDIKVMILLTVSDTWLYLGIQLIHLDFPNVQFGSWSRELILEFELPIVFDGLGECPTVLKIVVFLRLVLIPCNAVSKIRFSKKNFFVFIVRDLELI